MAPRHHSRLTPRVTGWAAHEEPFSFPPGPIAYAADAARFLQGTPAVPALYAARSGLEIVQRLGVASIRPQSVRQMQMLVDLAREAGFRVRTPEPAAERGGLAVIEGPEGRPTALARREVLVDYRPDAGLRVSTHFYTTDDDVRRFVAELRGIRDGMPRKSHGGVA